MSREQAKTVEQLLRDGPLPLGRPHSLRHLGHHESRRRPGPPRGGVRARAADYLAGQDAASPLVSPARAETAGLPPLLVQAGSHELLLDDSLRVDAGAAAADVSVTREITADVPHVFQGFASALDEGAAALDSMAEFMRARLRTQ